MYITSGYSLEEGSDNASASVVTIDRDATRELYEALMKVFDK